MKKNKSPLITKSFILWIMLLSCLFPICSFAMVRYVPADYPTIQSAINASSDGDEIIVSPGRYVENINIGGKNIILRSTDPNSTAVVSTTIIDGNNSGNVVTFAGNELTTCVLAGFTITKGNAPFGGGIRGNGTRATIQNNIITGNTASRGGGLYGCNGTIQKNHITSNSATEYGGGLNMCHGVIQSNIISSNTTVSQSGASDGGGGGICDCDGIIQNNTITANSVSGAMINMGAGLYLCDGVIQNNVISGNTACLL
ncbi:MAG: hypothetical protein N2246_09560, partial [Candidatus Sumerlaeia bacterium]|nr:hypothetical protein [Candidatus Sumerlaeia bacterium]